LDFVEFTLGIVRIELLLVFPHAEKGPGNTTALFLCFYVWFTFSEIFLLSVKMNFIGVTVKNNELFQKLQRIFFEK
jgi:hypothetical protein